MVKKYFFCLLALIAILLMPAALAKAWNDCPQGLTNDPGPGLCALYVDTNQDGICDHSETEPKAAIAGANVPAEKNQGQAAPYRYPILFLTILLAVSYAATYLLQKNKIVSLAQYYLFWNLVLLSAFFLSGLLGLLLAWQRNFAWTISLPFNPLVWHTNAGLVMFGAGLIHIWQRRSYFSQFWRKNKKQK